MYRNCIRRKGYCVVPLGHDRAANAAQFRFQLALPRLLAIQMPVLEDVALSTAIHKYGNVFFGMLTNADTFLGDTQKRAWGRNGWRAALPLSVASAFVRVRSRPRKYVTVIMESCT